MVPIVHPPQDKVRIEQPETREEILAAEHAPGGDQVLVHEQFDAQRPVAHDGLLAIGQGDLRIRMDHVGGRGRAVAQQGFQEIGGPDVVVENEGDVRRPRRHDGRVDPHGGKARILLVADVDDPRIPRRELAADRFRAVGRAVVDDDEFKIAEGLAADRLDGAGQPAFAVAAKRGHDDADRRRDVGGAVGHDLARIHEAF